MIQKNKFIFKFIYGVLVDEECESAKIISKQDLSKLVKSLENTTAKNINITPDLSQVSPSNDDIFIVLDDVELTQADIGKIKKFLSQKILIWKKADKMTETNEHMVRWGYQIECNKINENKMCFANNLKMYKNKGLRNNVGDRSKQKIIDKFEW